MGLGLWPTAALTRISPAAVADSRTAGPNGPCSALLIAMRGRSTAEAELHHARATHMHHRWSCAPPLAPTGQARGVAQSGPPSRGVGRVAPQSVGPSAVAKAVIDYDSRRVLAHKSHNHTHLHTADTGTEHWDSPRHVFMSSAVSCTCWPVSFLCCCSPVVPMVLAWSRRRRARRRRLGGLRAMLC